MSSKKITLKSSDYQAFVVDKEVALVSQTIKHLIEDGCTDNVIQLPNVTSEILSKVIEYCKKHAEAAMADKSFVDEADLKNWDAEFVRVDQITLFCIMLAAKYLDIQSLRNFTCRTIADMMADGQLVYY